MAVFLRLTGLLTGGTGIAEDGSDGRLLAQSRSDVARPERPAGTRNRALHNFPSPHSTADALNNFSLYRLEFKLGARDVP